MSEREVFPVHVAGVDRELPLFEVAPGVRIAIINILGDTELVQAAATQLARLLVEKNPEILLTTEAKSIPLIHALAVMMGLPYVVLRKNYKSYMGEALQTESLSITTGKPQLIYMDEKDVNLVKGRRVALVDDVISTGSTLEAMEHLVGEAGGEVVARAAIFTEGDQDKWIGITALGHLPVFVDKTDPLDEHA